MAAAAATRAAPGELTASTVGGAPRRAPVALLCLSTTALGCALQVNYGQYHPLALPWLGSVLAGVALCATKSIRRRATALDLSVAAACLAVQFVLLLSRSPGATGALAPGGDLLPFRAGVVAAAALCAAGWWVQGRWRGVLSVALVGVYAALGVWTLRAAPQPGVDVCVFQRESAEALLHGNNPYAVTFRDPYADSSRFYGPGVSHDGRLQFGYPYPPLSLVLIVPAHGLGDFRSAQLAATALAGLLVALARPGRLALAGAALLLFTPRGFFVLEAGWTEPLTVLFLAATVFALCRSPGWAAVPLGLLLASKQYAALALLATPLLPPDCPRLRTVTIALATAAAVTLPVALWDLPSFLRSVVLLQWHQPFREDALSFLVPLAQATGVVAPAWVAFVLAAGAAAVAVWKLPRGAGSFATSLAFTLLVFFAFNKQAFCNYYHLVIAALCCAIAATPGPERGEGLGVSAKPEEIRAFA
jgi:hypothetical protein